MANKHLDTEILDEALLFAVRSHSGTERRGKGFPYIVHPMEAVSIVATITNDQEILSAAALHDVVEDTDVTLEELQARFGERIASLVASETDKECANVSLSASWHERKQFAIERLASASRDAKIVAIGDKLSNMRAIRQDWVRDGDKVWNLFHVTDKKEHEWHYRGLLASFADLKGTFPYEEFEALVNEVFE